MTSEPSGPWDQPGNWKEEEMTKRKKLSRGKAEMERPYQAGDGMRSPQLCRGAHNSTFRPDLSAFQPFISFSQRGASPNGCDS